MGRPDWVPAPTETEALRACTAAMHKLEPEARLRVMESLRLFYLPDGSYHDRIDPGLYSEEGR